MYMYVYCMYVCVYVCIEYIYIYTHRNKYTREFTKGGLVKMGLAMYAFPVCNCNALGSVVNAQIENMPNC